MRAHVRTDTFKVYEEEDDILKTIMKDNKLSPKTGKSEAYRIALRTYRDLHAVPTAVETLKATLNEHTEQLKQLYFVIQAR